MLAELRFLHRVFTAVSTESSDRLTAGLLSSESEPLTRRADAPLINVSQLLLSTIILRLFPSAVTTEGEQRL